MFRTIQVYKIHLHKVLRQQLSSSVKRVFETDYTFIFLSFMYHTSESWCSDLLLCLCCSSLKSKHYCWTEIPILTVQCCGKQQWTNTAQVLKWQKHRKKTWEKYWGKLSIQKHYSISPSGGVNLYPKKQKWEREEKKPILQNTKEAPLFHVYLVTNPTEQNTKDLVAKSQKL